MARKPRFPLRPFHVVLAAGLLALPLLAAPTRAATLISAEEANLPPAAFPPQSRGITRGPTMKLESPDGPVASPFKLMVSFAAFGGAQIVPDSVKLTYLRNPSVDLTGRIKAYITPHGLGITVAEAPPGKHDLMLEAADSNQRVVKLPITIVVEPKK
jgi:hypothetical protein